MHGRRRWLPIALALLLGSAFVFSNLQTPWRVLGPPLAAALLQVGLLAWLERRVPEPWLLAASFFGGAVLADVVATLNLNQELGALLAAGLGDDRPRLFTPLLAAPVLEESAKGAALALLLRARRRSLDPVLDAIAGGALVGVGFAAAENVNYLFLTAVLGGGGEGLRWMTYRRLLGSLSHAVFTATFGAGLGLARGGRSGGKRLLPAAVGAMAAIGLHVFWNGVTSVLTQTVLCGTAAASGGCAPPDALSILAVPLIIGVSLAPGAIPVGVLALRARRRAASAAEVPCYGRTS